MNSLIEKENEMVAYRIGKEYVTVIDRKSQTGFVLDIESHNIIQFGYKDGDDIFDKVRQEIESHHPGGVFRRVWDMRINIIDYSLISSALGLKYPFFNYHFNLEFDMD